MGPANYGRMRLRPIGDADALKGRGVDLAVVRRAWELARPYRARLAGYLAVLVATSITAVLPAQLIRLAIDRAIPAADTGLLVWLFAGLLAVAVFEAVLSLVERWLSSSVGEGFIYDLRRMLYRHVQSMPLAFFTRTQTGALITRLNNDVIGAQRALTGTMGTVVANLIGVTVTLAAMFSLSWQVTLLSLALLPLFILPARIVGRRLQGLARRSMELNAEMNTTMTERFHVAGALLVKLFGRQERETERFGERAERVADIGVRTALYGRGLFAALGLVGAAATALVYLVGGLLVISPDSGLQIGVVVALGMYVTQLYGPLAQLSNAPVDLMTALVSFERVFEVMDLPRDIDEKDDARELTDPRGHVRFEGVAFRYPAAGGSSLESLEGPRSAHGDAASDWILRNIELDLRPGTVTALVGPSGAGKSTLSSLVPRLYDVTEGRVTVDGIDVRDLTLESLAHAVGVVSQDAHLFHESIADNLRYARADATQEQIEAACRAARIHHVIARLPDGYDTVVGERGYRLSGGEKQRVSLARVLLKDPAIVVLDEATAHLDTESERLVQAALRETLVGRTALVIAHRLSTVVDADEIVVLDEGTIVERGTHAELVRRGGLYADLARTQLVTSEAS
ncbi:ABC transporter [Egicoccus halophilus]|uniref:Fatty acid ABC transporter ATP-binding/permease protein n=2 Tax=Egicoccus halophilus TaxID=1670830 RepID=A0A8J3A875_9ACTN|nr:ABC transporter ATP-binding protein [Egicoccus halophilus]GGI06568.1 ABC transporter [Egicoccus halophilus]